MKRKFKLINAFFFSPKRDMKNLLNELSLLSIELRGLEQMGGDKIEEMLMLFKITSAFIDSNKINNLSKKIKRKNYGQLDWLTPSLDLICLNLNKCSRGTEINRSKAGNSPTIKDIYLRGEENSFKNNLVWFMLHKPSLKRQYRDIRRPENPVYLMSSWDIVEAEAKSFINDCVPETLEEISFLFRVHENKTIIVY